VLGSHGNPGYRCAKLFLNGLTIQHDKQGWVFGAGNSEPIQA
jgi:hypothetical protein